MKSLITIFFLLIISGWTYAQNYPSDGTDKVRIVEIDKVISADLKLVKHIPKPKADRFYYWYSANKVHATQGGFSGHLLNGNYSEFYLNKNLMTQGSFKNGLKTGEWKSWKEDGTLAEIGVWKDGLIYVKKPSHFWKDINLFRKHKKKAVSDTHSKSKAK